jgi:hypothetical protein
MSLQHMNLLCVLTAKFICLPYNNNFLVISLKRSDHVAVKVEFWVSPAVFL